jgi:hypothetical protein
MNERASPARFCFRSVTGCDKHGMDQLNLRDKALIKLLSKDNNGGATMMKRYALVVVLVPVLLFDPAFPA